ncbi:PLD nuclease N-terminal domain-containing protein [Tessaracoccus timonensis]|uniref:PLD nuclease N-terminal domain-containing protein n=1 Tax=Tessaracoccus timonensis TaxID=2161816 RepID=UPI000D556561|nr:PLD nuclease N-terminal domain-containing protein [Tessaracoccus timonensis]
MPRVLLIVAIIMLTLYCVIEVAQARSARVRRLPKWLWAFAVICVPVVGPISWLALGRPTNAPRKPLPNRAPDDDEDFLRGIR